MTGLFKSSLSSDYRIEIKFQMHNFDPFWKKVLDYQNLETDYGLYVREDRLQFFPAGEGQSLPQPTPIPLNTDVVVRITRDGDTTQVRYFVDNILQGSFDDAATSAPNCCVAVPASNILHFFQDDVVCCNADTLVGSVDWIRISVDAQENPRRSTILKLIPLIIDRNSSLRGSAPRQFR